MFARLFALLSVVLAIFLTLPHALAAQTDTAVVAHTTLWGGTFLGLWQVVGPALTSWLFKMWNTAQTSLSTWPNWLKRSAYIVGTTLVLQLAKLISYGGLPTDSTHWTPIVVLDFLTACVSTVLVALGINTARDKA